MFYSETLLSKTGPLARVWLSANLERKLSKTHILQSNIESSITAIVDQGQAPMALRLSGQLLLGVVRIYSRKARYLLDDCNEALMKLKMAFRPGNVDLPATHAHAPNLAALTLPDALTELDLLPAVPDATALLGGPSNLAEELQPDAGRIGRSEDITLLDQTTQLLSEDIERGRNAPEDAGRLEEEVLDLDLGFGDEPPSDVGPEASLHVGREAPPARPLEEEFGDQSKLGEDTVLGRGVDAYPEDVADALRPDRPRPTASLGDLEDIGMDLGMGMGMDIPSDLPAPEGLSEVPAAPRAPAEEVGRRRERDTVSPLSVLRESQERQLEEEYGRRGDETTEYDIRAEEEPEESTLPPRRQRVRRGRAVQADADTTLPFSHIKRLQEDRSRVLKPASFLPRDPVLMALMEMQQSGGFVSSIMGDGRGRGWAPELRGILSLEVVRKSGKLKRKHDAERAAAGQEQQQKRPRLEVGTAGQEEDEQPLLTGAEAELAIPDITIATEGGEIIELPAAADAAAAAAAAAGTGAREMSEPSVGGGMGSMLPLAAVRGSSETAAHVGADQPFVFASDDDGAAIGAAAADERFDETTAPLVHPADSGPISLGTKHAVHLLRERFGPEAADSPSQRSQASVLFQELLLEQRTSKADATKMFFEVLVLATKDAIKVEQDPNVLGAPIRVRGKRGLWGAWAETRAGGEISSQEEEDDGAAGASGDAGTAAPAVAIPAVAAPVALGQVAVGA